MRLFCIKDLLANKEVEVAHCPTERMIADCNAKPLGGRKFKIFRHTILNLSGIHHFQVGQQECIGQTRAQIAPYGATECQHRGRGIVLRQCFESHMGLKNHKSTKNLKWISFAS